MNRKIFAIATVVLVVSAGIIVHTGTKSSVTHDTTQDTNPLKIGSLTTPNGDFVKTKQLVEQSALAMGQYRPLLTDDASLYATHNFISISDVGIFIPNKGPTREWLKKIQNRSFQTSATDSNKTIAVLKDRYYTIKSLNRLNSTIREDLVRNDLQKFRLPVGSYCRKRPRNGSCSSGNGSILATYWAVSISEATGGLSEENRTETISWLLSQWEGVNQFQSIEDVGLGNRIIQTLHKLDVDLESLSLNEQGKNNLQDHYKQISSQKDSQELDLGYLYAYSGVREQFSLNNQSFDQKIERHLIHNQNSDGGFGVFSQNVSDSKGTALALWVLSQTGISKLDSQSLRRFIKYHAIPEGGFAFTSSTSSSMKTTQYAVSSLELLNESPKYSDTISNNLRETYKTINNSTKPISPESIFTLTTIAKTVGSSPPPQNIVNHSLNYTFRQNLSEMPLSQLFYAVSTGAEYGYDLPEQKIASRLYTAERPSGGFGTPASSINTYYGVETLHLINRTVSRPERTIEFLKATEQNGGYRLRRGQQFAPYPDVYATYLTLSTLAELKSGPDNRTKTRVWLKSLQDDRGFFRPYNDRTSEPQIQHTYWALQCFDILEETRTGDHPP